ncbi:MAG TPA: ABC transporter ATP-binding protein [Enteractinococcus sp.]
MLSLSNVHREVRVRKGRFHILKGISFEAKAGEVTALLGPNGAGKTTTLSIAQGIDPATSGTVRLLGVDPYRAGADLRSQVGVMLQEGGLPMAVTGERLLQHLQRLYRYPADIDGLMDRLQIHDYKDRQIRRLSGGQRQRLGMAAALVGRPKVIFLDEPSAGLDPVSRRIVFDLIEELKSLGVCIILTTHLLEDAQRLADHVVLIRDGRVEAAGTVEELTSTGLHPPLSFRLDTPLTAAQQDDFPAHLTLSTDEVAPTSLVWYVSGIETPADLHALSAWWVRHDLMPVDLGLTGKSLEDVFMELTAHDHA